MFGPINCIFYKDPSGELSPLLKSFANVEFHKEFLRIFIRLIIMEKDKRITFCTKRTSSLNNANTNLGVGV